MKPRTVVMVKVVCGQDASLGAEGCVSVLGPEIKRVQEATVSYSNDQKTGCINGCIAEGLQH